MIATSAGVTFASPGGMERHIAELTAAQRRKALRITDRKEAIKTACSLAGAGDIVLVAGKGHEKYQDINGVKHHFDDKEVVQEMFELLGK